jgi:hypothetical protein
MDDGRINQTLLLPLLVVMVMVVVAGLKMKTISEITS